jgi:hypothetical protein
MVRRFVRESAFNLARRDLAVFLEEHEEDMLAIFREELQRLDDEIPEENFFIDIRIVPLGETIVRAALNAIRRFLTDDLPVDRPPGPPAASRDREDVFEYEED